MHVDGRDASGQTSRDDLWFHRSQCRSGAPAGGTANLSAVTGILLATDSDALYSEVDACLASDSQQVWRVRKGADVLRTIEVNKPDLVLLDLQIGNMGGIATCLAIRQEEGFNRLSTRPVALLLDRSADVFLAQEAGADGWLVKPLDALRLRRLTMQLLAGNTLFEGVTAGH